MSVSETIGVLSQKSSILFTLTDNHSDSMKMARLIIPTKAAIPVPVFAWRTPDSIKAKTDFAVVNIAGIVKTRSNIVWLKVFVNGQIPDDEKSFKVLATQNLNEYRIERTITLNEGDNEIKVEVKNEQGVTTSDSRVINYFVLNGKPNSFSNA